jgi:hypothetical protein
VQRRIYDSILALMRTGARSSAGALLALALLVATAVAALAAPVYVSVNAGGHVLAVRPKRIHLVSNEDLSGLRWRSWGGTTANARGSDHGNFPSPGLKASNPVQVRAADRRRCGSKLIYTTIHLHFTKGVPYAGQPRDTEYAYGCPP